MGAILNLVRMIIRGTVSSEITRQLVYRAPQAHIEADRINGAWERRIIELGDGKSIAEITETLFREEVEAGASSSDIGIWRNLIDQSVVKTIEDLAVKGYIYLETDKTGR